MADLIAKSPCAGLLPVQHGGLVLTECAPEAIHLLAAYQGAAAKAGAALEKAHGLGWPKPGTSTQSAQARALWFAPDQALLLGAVPVASLARHCAITDQSDGWARVDLTGQGAEDVLARLVPVDLRAQSFPEGAVARTAVFHMSAVITRTGAASFEILVFRSMAQTLVHELLEAMKSVVAQQS
ncbi:sarcosine oxidase subunit gamma [Pseudoruegeria sp. SHC-113]|uniref:sarcosine oxidase subunit gamma n=1 Tax=Pseudoruegeria sp. SHC-113 TaxID=2855439 RepID=UPI0021BA7F25|nr:sarcosine oxidase subunit gamma family protein [Pseudoruegeria sp. SHC-113]MCT8159159.1 sarcosine oxidase subunit gamma [Pseudoruegeria sp. SHC-113]